MYICQDLKNSCRVQIFGKTLCHTHKMEKVIFLSGSYGLYSRMREAKIVFLFRFQQPVPCFGKLAFLNYCSKLLKKTARKLQLRYLS